MMRKVKIFVTYYTDDKPIIKSDIYQPIMAGNMGKALPDGFIGDDTGDNISHLNNTYGEMTAHYWLWKNYLPTAKEEYIGLCHYRRFLNFSGNKYDFSEKKETEWSPLDMLYYKYFVRFMFSDCTENSILDKIDGYDLVTTKKWHFRNTNRMEFDYWHPGIVLDQAMDILDAQFPEYTPYAKKFFSDTEGYYCLCFIMKRELLVSFLEWQFKIVKELDKINTNLGYTDDHYMRTPAFIMERFYNIWIRYQIGKNKVKLLEMPAFKLDFDMPPEKRIKYLKNLASNKMPIGDDDMDELAARHPVLNGIIKPLVNQKKYYKLLGDPRRFFSDSSSIMIRLFGVFYK